jgi:hypothetical protein
VQTIILKRYYINVSPMKCAKSGKTCLVAVTTWAAARRGRMAEKNSIKSKEEVRYDMLAPVFGPFGRGRRDARIFPPVDWAGCGYCAGHVARCQLNFG